MISDVTVCFLLLVITSVIQYYRKLAQAKARLREEYGLKLAHSQEQLQYANRFIEMLEVELKKSYRAHNMGCLQRQGLYRKVTTDRATQTPDEVTYKVSRRTSDGDDLEIIGAIEAEVELRHYLHIIQSKSRGHLGTGANRSNLDSGGSTVKNSIDTVDATDHSNPESNEKTMKENQIEPVETGSNRPDTIEGSGDENCSNHTQGCQTQITHYEEISPEQENDKIHQGCGKANMQNEEILDLLLMEDALLDNGPLSETSATEDQQKISPEETNAGGTPKKKSENAVDCSGLQLPATGLESFTYYCSVDNYDLVTGPKGRNLQFLQQAFGVHVVVLQDDPKYKSLNVVGTTVQLTEARNYLENGVLGRLVERELTRVVNPNSKEKW